jgi:hypothetical protein
MRISGTTSIVADARRIYPSSSRKDVWKTTQTFYKQFLFWAIPERWPNVGHKIIRIWICFGRKIFWKTTQSEKAVYTELDGYRLAKPFFRSDRLQKPLGINVRRLLFSHSIFRVRLTENDAGERVQDTHISSHASQWKYVGFLSGRIWFFSSAVELGIEQQLLWLDSQV